MAKNSLFSRESGYFASNSKLVRINYTSLEKKEEEWTGEKENRCESVVKKIDGFPFVCSFHLREFTRNIQMLYVENRFYF